MRPRRVILWDVDGTLLSAGPIGRGAFYAAATEVLGRDVPNDGAVQMSGKTDPMIAREILEHAGVEAPGVEALLPEVLERLGGHGTSSHLDAETPDHLRLERVREHRDPEAALGAAERDCERALVRAGRRVELHRFVAVEAQELHDRRILSPGSRRQPGAIGGQSRRAAAVCMKPTAITGYTASAHTPVAARRSARAVKKT